jgi:predicted transcriptional regulator
VPVKKVRVEVFDESGNRYTVSVEGKVTRKSALRILDMVDLLGGIPSSELEPQGSGESSKIDKVKFVIEKHFPLIRFSANEAQSVYNVETGEQINLSTISTYLSRLSDKGFLMKEKNSNRVSYRLVSEGIKRLLENR